MLGSCNSLLFPSHYLKNFGQALDRAFHTMRYFRTLDLSSSMILELPGSIDELKLLRYLDLSRTEIKFLPNSICNLYNLETLKLLGCPWLFKLPKDLGNLVNLRHMELEDLFWFKFSVLPPKVGNLTRLQNWHAFRVGNKIGYRIEELKNMAYLSGTLHISQLENVVNVVEAKMNEKKGNEFPAWMREGGIQNLVSVTLNDCTNCKTLTLGELPNLRVLCVKGMQELEKWPEVRCPSLSRLKFSNCPKLRELPNCFPKLRTLKIKSCISLRALPVAPSLMFLTLIDNLILEDWSEVVTAWEPMCGSWFNLLELNVTSCPKLQTLPIDFAPQKLEISGCELLVALPQPHFAERLQHLALDACLDGTLVRAIPNTSSLYSLVISGVSNLTSLPQWPQLPGLKALYIRDCKDLMSLSESKEASLSTLLSLTLLSIRNCPMLVKLTEELPATLECLSIGSCPFLQSLGPKEILKSLPSLKDLYIEDCPMLQSLPEDGLPSSLQHLQIQRCPLLTERCQMEEGGGGGPDRPKVMHIPDLEIDFPTASSTSAYCFITNVQPKKARPELLCDLDESWHLDWNEIPSASTLKGLHSSESHFCQANDTIERCTNLIKPMAEIVSQLEKNKENFLKLDSVEATIQSINESQINELQQKVDKQKTSTVGKSISGAKGQINDLKQKGKAREEKKIIYTDGKKLKEKWDVATNAEKEKKAAEKI
uniref:Disease resistance R13L4/SHOC-2-like LRR domain-containing protein n=1 Tax=Quercus lobata TaxID=97700 RepID=A0A7N2L4P7_QUELO